MDAERTEFKKEWSNHVQGFIQRSPPGHLPDVIAGSQQLVHPAVSPTELIWRSAAANNERNMLIVQNPEESVSQDPATLLLVHETLRQGSRAQKLVPYKDPRSGKIFVIDHERQVCTKIFVEKQDNDLLAELKDVDHKVAAPFKEALQAELDSYIADRYAARGGSSTGAATGTVQSSSGEEVGNDVELKVLISARRARPHGLWAGQWTSQWRIRLAPAQAEPAQLAGIIEFTTHYSEDGNVHFKRTDKPRLKIAETTDPEIFAQQVIKAIHNVEDKFHEETEVQCESYGDGVFKSLRRSMPVSKERFDWRPLRQAIVKDMKAGT